MGGFSIDCLGPEIVDFRICVPEESPYALEGDDFFWVEAGNHNIRIPLRRRGIVWFHAVEEEGGKRLESEITGRIPGESNPLEISVHKKGPGLYALFGPIGEREYILETEGFSPLRCFLVCRRRESRIRKRPLKFKAGVPLSGGVTFITTELKNNRVRRSLSRERDEPIFGAFVFYQSLSHPGEVEHAVPVKRTGAVTGTYRIPHLVPGPYRIRALAPGFISSTAQVVVGHPHASHDFTIRARFPEDLPPVPRLPYKRCKNLNMYVWIDAPLQIFLDWVIESTGADVKIRKGQKLENTNIAIGTGGSLTLSEVMGAVLGMQRLRINEDTGEILGVEED
jgi:hypothetical protein